MPVKKCSKDGKSGKKYGDEGKCYTGSGVQSKAVLSKPTKPAVINNP